MLDLLKDTQNSPSPWFNVVPSLEKLCWAAVARNDQANLQSTLNNEAGGVSLTIFVILGVKEIHSLDVERVYNMWLHVKNDSL